MIGGLSIPAPKFLASGEVLKLKVFSLSHASQRCLSLSIPQSFALFCFFHFEEIISPFDYLLLVHVPVLHFRNERSV